MKVDDDRLRAAVKVYNKAVAEEFVEDDGETIARVSMRIVAALHALSVHARISLLATAIDVELARTESQEPN